MFRDSLPPILRCVKFGYPRGRPEWRRAQPVASFLAGLARQTRDPAPDVAMLHVIPYYEGMTAAARLAFGLLAGASFGNELKAQSCSTFDVASIKPNTSGVGGGYPELAPGGRHFTAPNQHIVELIMFAYDVSPLRISGIPSGFPGGRYDIEATCEQPMAKEQV